MRFSEYILLLIENLYSGCFWAKDGNRKWTFRMPGQWSLVKVNMPQARTVVSPRALKSSAPGCYIILNS